MEIAKSESDIKNYQTYDCLPEFQADPNTEYDCSPLTKSTGFTPLMRMVQCADRVNILGIITTHIKKYPLDLDHQNEKGWTALMIACRNSSTTSSNLIVDLLLKAGAKINLKHQKWTALTLACRYSGTDSTNKTIELLLAAGADVDLQDDDGWNGLMMACMYSRTVSTNKAVKILLEAGANVNLQNNKGSTALMLACCNNNKTSTIKTVELLLDADADVNLVNIYGKQQLIC